MTGPRIRPNSGEAPINDSNTSESTPAVSCAPTPVPAHALVLTPAPALVSVLAPPARYTDKDLQKATN